MQQPPDQATAYPRELLSFFITFVSLPVAAEFSGQYTGVIMFKVMITAKLFHSQLELAGGKRDRRHTGWPRQHGGGGSQHKYNAMTVTGGTVIGFVCA